MKKKNLLVVLLFFVTVINTYAATYYFSSSNGNDSRTAAQAQSENTPWKSLEKLNSIMGSLSPGDRILFKRGETFYGTIRITRSGTLTSPITFGAYGEGQKPVITSFVKIEGWTSKGNGIYESNMEVTSDSRINIVTIEGRPYELGRYPNFEDKNKGYLNIESIPGSNSISSSELTGSNNWSGGEVVIRKNPWIIDKHPILSHSGSQINFGSAQTSYTASKNYGFFIQNHLKTLDQFGEWYYNKETRKLNVFFGNQNPNNSEVKISNLSNLIIFDWDEGNITFTDLDIQGANQSGIRIQSGTNVKVLNSNISFTGEYGVFSVLAHNLEVNNNKFNHSYNNAVYVENSTQNVKITNNEINNTFMFNGMGRNSDLNGQAIYTTNDSHNGLIENNQITNTGYIGINFGGDRTKVRNNFVNNFCVHKTDGGGIYTWEGPNNHNLSDRVIEGNIIIDGIGYTEGTPGFGTINKPQVEGIYLDDNSSGISIKNNSIANISNNGVYFHNARNITFENNLSYNCFQHVLLSNDYFGDLVRNIDIKNNIFFMEYPDEYFLKIFSMDNDFELMGNFDQNYYVNPFGNDFGFIQEFMFPTNAIENKLMNLFWWNRDKKGNLTPQQYSLLKDYSLSQTNLFTNKDFKENILKTYCNSNCKSSWKSSGYFNNGHVSVNASKKSQFTLETGNLNKNSYYILRFSARANKEGYLSLDLNESDSPWRRLSEPQGFSINAEIKEYEFVFHSLIDVKSSLITFKSDLADFTYALDNVEFFEANINFNNPDDYLIFEYNASGSSKKFPLSGTYVDARNNQYSGTIDIPAFSSVALMKVSDDGGQEPEPPTISILTPSIDTLLNIGDKLKIKVEAKSKFSEIQQVDLFLNDNLIKSIEESPYEYEHLFDEDGEFVLKAKAVDRKGLETYAQPRNIKVKKAANAPEISWLTPSHEDFFFASDPIKMVVFSENVEDNIVKIDFSIDNNVVGTTNNAPYQITLPNLPLGVYNLSAKATNSDGLEGVTETITIRVIEEANVSPTVSITSPADNAQFIQGDAINITANAQDADGTITKVEFYFGNTLLGTDLASPYSFTWNNPAIGTHAITARATDNKGAVTTSPVISIKVIEKANVAPTVSITSPADNAQFIQGDAINITANAQDADGTIAKVEFYFGNTLLGTDSAAPYSFTWNNPAIGTHAITVRATDNKGAVTTSPVISIKVNEKANVAPTVSITSPADNAQFIQGDAINITSNAQDADGTIAKVEFYFGNTLLGTDSAAPYSFTWNNPAIGTHAITARATDNKGAVTTSSVINIQVIERLKNPSFRFVSPLENAEYFMGDNLLLDIEVSAESSEIVKIEYFRNNILIASKVNGDFKHNWKISVLGKINLTALATDKNGKTASNTKAVTIIERTNEFPTIKITSPADNTEFVEGDTITLVAEANDSDGTISFVEFFNDNKLIGQANKFPYVVEWKNIAVGSYKIVASATDNRGGSTVSVPIQIHVKKDISLPEVELLSPVNNQIFDFEEKIDLMVMFKDSPKNVSRVDYYAGDQHIKSSNEYPYFSEWTPLTPGDYLISAKVIGSSSEIYNWSDINKITVKAEPVFRIISPTALTEHQVGVDLEIKVEIPNSPKEIDRVQYFRGNTLIGESTSLPYDLTWANVPLGETNLISKLIYKDGSSLLSIPIKIFVIEKPIINLIVLHKKLTFSATEKIDVKPEFNNLKNEIAKAEFYVNGVLVGLSNTAPYTYSFTDLALGNQMIWVEITDVNGNRYFSEKIQVNIVEGEVFEEINLTDFKMGPNPTSRYLNLYFSEIDQPYPIIIEIVAINGKIAKNFNYVLEDNEITLDLENLKMGIYLLRIHYQGKIIITKRFIKKN